MLRDVLALRHDCDLPPMKERLTEALGPHETFDSLELDVGLALGLVGGLLYKYSDAPNHSAVLEVLFELLSSGFVVHVPHEHRAVVWVASRHSGSLMGLVEASPLEAALLRAGVLGSGLLVNRKRCNLVRVYGMLTLVGEVTLELVKVPAFLDESLQLVIEGHIEGLMH